MESLIRYGMAAWFGSLTVQYKSKTEKMFKSAMKVNGNKNYSSLFCEKIVVKQAQRIVLDPSHVLHSEYEVLPSGRWYRACRYKGYRYKLSFLPTSDTSQQAI